MIQPRGNRVLIQPHPASDMTDGGIYLPVDSKDTNVAEGTVIAGCMETGLTVLYDAYAGATVKHKGESYVLVQDENVWAVIE